MAKRLRASGKTYNEIGEILGVTLFSARKMCTYVPKLNYKKGPMPIIDKKIQLRIKRSKSPVLYNRSPSLNGLAMNFSLVSSSWFK